MEINPNLKETKSGTKTITNPFDGTIMIVDDKRPTDTTVQQMQDALNDRN